MNNKVEIEIVNTQAMFDLLEAIRNDLIDVKESMKYITGDMENIRNSMQDIRCDLVICRKMAREIHQSFSEVFEVLRDPSPPTIKRINDDFVIDLGLEVFQK